MKLRYLLLLPLFLLLAQVLKAQSNCSTITFELTSDTPGSKVGCNPPTSVYTYNETMDFIVKCYNTQNAANYFNTTTSLTASGQCLGSADCPPPKQVDQGAPYKWSKKIPATASGYNQLYLTPVNNTFIPALYACSSQDGSAKLVQCLTQDCGCAASRICNFNSPVVIDTTGNGFPMTDWQNGVSFDMEGTGTPVKMGWTAKGSGVGFLALPALDGLVHNGTQLFGNNTPQPPSDNPNGFLALAVYDQPDHGGNGDGRISPYDLIWDSLSVWIDANHDGICTKDEMHSLAELGIKSISLHYHESPKVDQWGNQFRDEAFINEKVDHRVWDVWFVLCPN